MSVISAIRSLALNLVLFVGLALSHHLGGGTFSFSPTLLPLFGFSFAVFWLRPCGSVRGPYLALLLVFVQVLGHLDLVSGPHISTMQMVLSHTLGIGLSYYLASNFDRGLLSLFELLRAFFKPIILIYIGSASWKLAVARAISMLFPSKEFSGTCQRRGPPFFATA